ncbi:MAG: sulfatase [Planctomycetota bacterium]
MRTPVILAAVLLASAAAAYFVMRPSSRGESRQRISLGAVEDPRALRETVQQEIQRSRAMQSRVLSDVRDARVARLGEAIREERKDGVESVATAVCVLVDGELGLRGAARVRFEIVIEREKGLETTAPVELSLQEAAAGFHRLQLDAFGGPGVAYTLRSTSLSQPDGGTLDPQAVRVCWARPSVVGKTAPEQRTNVLIVSVDTLRADHLSCYGHTRATSPNIDALAARGVLFERALSTAPWTLPSYGTLFSGMEVAKHKAGVIAERESAWGKDEAVPTKVATQGLRADVRTLAERLVRARYRTAGFYSNTFLNPNSGLDRGFETYVYYQYNAASGVDLAQQWVDDHAREPWFVFLHLMDPHAPYAPPAPYDQQFAGRSVETLESYPPDTGALRQTPPSAEFKKQLIDLYDGEIAFTDAQIGRFLDHLAEIGELDDTLVVFHSDHGEEFWEHGGFEHGHDLHDEVLHVPLILALPGKLAPGARVAARVSTADILPTVLELLGVESSGALDGRSLLPLVGARDAAPRDLVSESILWGKTERKARFAGDLKLIAMGASDDRLFDLAQDPGERQDLAPLRRADVERLRAELVKRHVLTQKLPAGVTVRHTDAQRAALEKTGYVGSDDDDEE